MSSSHTSPLLYNSRIIDTYMKLIINRYSYVNVTELLSFADMKPYEIADQGHWFTQEQVNRFYEKLVSMTRNEHIAREAGRYAASPDAIGVMRQYILGMVTPATVYELIGKATANFTRSSTYESRRLSPSSIEITVTPHEGVTEQQFQCENRLGFFDAIVNIYQNKFPRIEHPECMFTGGKVCRYIISWENSPSIYWATIRNYSLLPLLTLNLLLAFLGEWTLLESSGPLSLALYLFLMLVTKEREAKEMKTSLENTRDSVDSLLEQINRNYNNALMANEIGRAISIHTSVPEILTSVSQIMNKRLDFDRGLILLANEMQTELVLCSGYGYSEEHIQLISNISFHLDRPEARGIFVVSFNERKPFLVNDLNEIEESLSPRSMEFARQMGSRSFICCPIVYSDRSRGIVAVDNVNSKRPLIESDMSLLMGIASSLGISLRNAEYMESSIRQFNSIIQVLAASIDARDNLTAGHSKKVTEYALGMCDELGLNGDYRKMIQVAALLHDYGKIGVPDAILKKQGNLTSDEYEAVKQHADKSREILEQINFEGMYRQIPEIVGAHHEKIDGTGYPRGLKGKDIPVGAQIISVADYFEAITAKRHYRDPMPVEEAFDLMRGKIGVHFDGNYVEALIASYTRSYLSPALPPHRETE
jgi:putative nucleotidyltransferase with HDIG domain